MANPTVADIEAAILDRLRTQIPDVAVDAYPDRPEQYQLKHAVGACLVRYAESQFTEPDRTDVVIQAQRITMEVVTQVRNLRDHGGMLALLHTVRQALTGFRIPGASACYPVSEAFEDYVDGVWQYVTAFVVGVPHTEPPVTRPKIDYIEGVGYADDEPRFVTP